VTSSEIFLDAEKPAENASHNPSPNASGEGTTVPDTVLAPVERVTVMGGFSTRTAPTGVWCDIRRVIILRLERRQIACLAG
jgi:hypothetical protein